MLVCHCNGVSDRHIRRSIREGASTTSEVARSCGAGACCGGCHEGIRKILHAEMAEREERISIIEMPSAAPA
jgi:bacterioferritin-associated ferredoxin